MDHPRGACVFAPDLILTVTVEAGMDGDEVHLHAGGQGFWIARMINALGVDVSLCGAFGGESGQVIRHLIGQEPGIALRAVETAGANGAYLHDRREGERAVVAETPPRPLSRHEVDDLYGAGLVAGLDAGVCVLAGPGHWPTPALPAEVYRRLAADLSANGVRVVADLCGEPLREALAGGLFLVKVSHEELEGDGRLGAGGERDLRAAMEQLRREGTRHVLVTRAAAPALALIEEEVVEVVSPRLEASDHRGAGDSMTGGLTAGIARGSGLVEALRLGAAAGALNVTRRGLATGDRREIERLAAYIGLQPAGTKAHAAPARPGPPGPDGSGRPDADDSPEDLSPEDLTARTASAAGPGAPSPAHPPEGPRRCLVTNDDGIGSEGLRVLALTAREAGLEVTVAAPLEDVSGASASITAVEAGGRFVVERRTLPGLEDREVFGVGGLPAFIALTGARGAFGPRPDVVVSGINNGPNTGHAVLHSGTVGAALTAATHGLRALAVSMYYSGPPRARVHWETAAGVVRQVLPGLLRAPPGTVWNVNVPDVPPERLRGLRPARLAGFGAVQTNVAERGEGYVKISLSTVEAELVPGTDVALLREGYATVTALRPVCEEAGAVG